MRAFLLLIATLLSSSAFAVEPVGQRVDIGGRKLHLVCMGQGPHTVVLESGAALGFYEWWLVQNALKAEMRTCSYDRAGFGWSDPRDTRSMAGYVDDLHELLHRSGEKPPFLLVGHSMGGSLVQRYYWKYRSDVAGIIAVDPANLESSQPKLPEYQEAAALHRARRTKEMEEWRKTNRWPKQDFPPQLPATLRSKLVAASASREWWEARFAEGALPDLDVRMSAEERSIGVPLVVIAARAKRPDGWSEEAVERMRKRSLEGQQEIVSRSTHSKLIFTDAGHEVPLEDPDIVVREIRAMTADVWPTTAR